MQTKIILILIIAVMLFGGSAAFLAHRLKVVTDERDQVIEFNNARGDSLKFFINAWGRESARAEVLDLTTRNTKKLLDDERLAWTKQFASLKKNLRNLEQASRTMAEATGEFIIPFNSIDTTSVFWIDASTRDLSIATEEDLTAYYCPKRTFDNRYEWFRIQGYVTSDTLVVTPYVPIALESVLLWERKRKFLGIRFGKKKYFSETSSPNPHVKILKNEVTRVGKRKRK